MRHFGIVLVILGIMGIVAIVLLQPYAYMGFGTVIYNGSANIICHSCGECGRVSELHLLDIVGNWGGSSGCDLMEKREAFVGWNRVNPCCGVSPDFSPYHYGDYCKIPDGTYASSTVDERALVVRLGDPDSTGQSHVIVFLDKGSWISYVSVLLGIGCCGLIFFGAREAAKR